MFARGIQEKEIGNLIGKLNTFQDRPIILCGDFNAEEDSVVYNIMKLGGYVSAFANVHNHEPAVTHRTHRNEDVLADYILYKNVSDTIPQVKATDSFLLPIEATDEVWLESFDISDHRPLVASFEIYATNKL